MGVCVPTTDILLTSRLYQLWTTLLDIQVHSFGTLEDIRNDLLDVKTTLTDIKTILSGTLNVNVTNAAVTVHNDGSFL